MSQWWMCFLSLLTAANATGSIPSKLDKDVLDVIAGETFLVRTWTESHHLNSITVKKDDIIRLSAFLFKDKNIIIKDPKGALVLKYNNDSRKLMLENVTKENEGIYILEENVYDTKPDPFTRKAGKWNFHLNVVEQHEVKECNVGENIVMKFRTSSLLSHLYYYDQTVAFFLESDCNIGTHSHLYGRLWCSIDKDMYTIRIQNATQRDAGLYKVVKDNSVIERSFLNITDQPTYATTGGNVTIGWFYSQQGINRTLRIIHSNKGIMMMLPPTNDPQIMRDFQERLLYNGKISRSYMSFTLLNLEKSDSGVYTVETLHGNTIPGSKHLIVEDVPLNARNIIPESTSVYIELTDTSTTRGPYPVTLAEILDNEENPASLPHTVRPTSPGSQSILLDKVYEHTFVIYAISGAVVLLFLVQMIGCLIWFKKRDACNLKPERCDALEEGDTDLYLTPIAAATPLMISLRENERTGHSVHPSNTAPNAQFDPTMRLLHCTLNPCTDGYETVDISGNDDPENSSQDNQTMYESKKTSGHIWLFNSAGCDGDDRLKKTAFDCE